MKKCYSYLLFRIYTFYKDVMKEKSNLTLYTSFVSTVLISINLMSVYFFFEYIELVPFIPSKYYIIVLMVIVWVINYYGIVKKEKFLKYDFKKDKKGGYIIISIIITTFLSAILIGSLNREKIFKERKEIQSIEPQKESLEGKIRKWFEE